MGIFEPGAGIKDGFNDFFYGHVSSQRVAMDKGNGVCTLDPKPAKGQIYNPFFCINGYK
jgi:hypothetical protein